MKKIVWILVLGTICVGGACIPALVFHGMDAADIGRAYALDSVPVIAGVSASELPEVQSIRNYLITEYVNTPWEGETIGSFDDGNASAGEQMHDVPNYLYFEAEIHYETMYEEMKEFLECGAVPGAIVSRLQQQNVVNHSTYEASYRLQDVFQTFFVDDKEFYTECTFTKERDTHLIVLFQIYSTYSDEPLQISKEEEEAIMRAYVTYLGLDVLGDWEMRDDKLYSPSAVLAVVLNWERKELEFSYSIGIELV